MTAVKVWSTILGLATSAECIGTDMFLADLKVLIDVSSAPDGITAHDLDIRVEGVFKVCDQFTSVSALKDFICSCLRAKVIKLVPARGDKIGYAHGQANNFLITKRLEGGDLSLKDTQYALDLAARFMAEDSKPTPTPAKTYLTTTAHLPLNIDEKTEQKERIAMLLRFYEKHKDVLFRFYEKHKDVRMAIAAAKAAEEMVVVDAVADAAADEAGTTVGMVLLSAIRPLARQLLAAMILRRQATRRNFVAPIKAAPARKLTTHLRASIMLNLSSIANASARRPPALPPFSLSSPAINLVMTLIPLIILVCLILILPTLHVCPLLQHPRTRQHHRPVPHSGLVLRPRLPLSMSRSTATRRKALYSIAAPR